MHSGLTEANTWSCRTPPFTPNHHRHKHTRWCMRSTKQIASSCMFVLGSHCRERPYQRPQMEKDERRKRWKNKRMREKSRGEEKREQKGPEQHEQESSLTLLTVICRPHTLSHTLKHRTHVQSTTTPHTRTHTHLTYTKKSCTSPLWTHNHARSHSPCVHAALCHFDSDLPPTASQQAWRSSTHTLTHMQRTHNTNTLTLSKPTYLLPISQQEDTTRELIIVSSFHIFQKIHHLQEPGRDPAARRNPKTACLASGVWLIPQDSISHFFCLFVFWCQVNTCIRQTLCLQVPCDDNVSRHQEVSMHSFMCCVSLMWK